MLCRGQVPAAELGDQPCGITRAVFDVESATIGIDTSAVVGGVRYVDGPGPADRVTRAPMSVASPTHERPSVKTGDNRRGGWPFRCGISPVARSRRKSGWRYTNSVSVIGGFTCPNKRSAMMNQSISP